MIHITFGAVKLLAYFIAGFGMAVRFIGVLNLCGALSLNCNELQNVSK